MPPFQPTRLSVPLLHERRLSSAEILVFKNWALSGAPRGAAGKWEAEKPAPQFAPSRTWALTEATPLPDAGPDLYRCLVVPAELAESQWISAFRFVPGNKRVVHHALFFFDLSGAARKLDREAEGPGYPCFGSPGFLPVSSLGGWSPGNNVLEMPPGTAVRAPAGADLVLQIHYHLSGKAEQDLSRLEVRFAKEAPAKRLLDIPLTSKDIDIPPGSSSFAVRDDFEIPVAVTLWQIIPHAHFLARRMRAWASIPGQTRKVILAIDDWDFNWQDIYQLRTPLRLPAGTKLEMEIRYDNTEQNPRNPHRPPKRVGWGLGTEDEMAGMHWNVSVDDEARDLDELTSHLWGKMIRSTGIGQPRRTSER